MTPLLEAAFSYIESSPQWPLFPVHPLTKRPLIKTGTDHAEHASTDPDVIERWLTRDYPGCGIGMPTGRASGTVVIDEDAKHDGAALRAELEAALCPLPIDRVAGTPNAGRHTYCAHPGDVRVITGAGPNSALGRLLGGRAGVDVRADGGIVVLPPSFGRRWIADDDTLPPLPKLWLCAINGAGDPPPRPRTPWEGDRRWSDPARGGLIPDGERSDRLYRIGVAVRLAGANDNEIADHLERVNASRCSPPIPARELDRIIKSAVRAGGRR